MAQLSPEQTKLSLDQTSSPAEQQRSAFHDRLAETGIRPPKRLDVRPEDLEPPVQPLGPVLAFLVRLFRRLAD